MRECSLHSLLVLRVVCKLFALIAGPFALIVGQESFLFASHSAPRKLRSSTFFDTVRKTAKVVDSWFGQATRMVDVKHVDAFQGLFRACVSGLEAVS